VWLCKNEGCGCTETTWEFQQNNILTKKRILYNSQQTYILVAPLHNVGGEMWQLLEIRVLLPHGLRDHLGQLHGGEGRREPAVAAEHVDARLDETYGLAEDLLCVRLELSGELHAGHVRLQEQVHLDMRVVELCVLWLVRQTLCQLKPFEIYLKSVQGLDKVGLAVLTKEIIYEIEMKLLTYWRYADGRRNCSHLHMDKPSSTFAYG